MLQGKEDQQMRNMQRVAVYLINAQNVKMYILLNDRYVNVHKYINSKSQKNTHSFEYF